MLVLTSCLASSTTCSLMWFQTKKGLLFSMAQSREQLLNTPGGIPSIESNAERVKCSISDTQRGSLCEQQTKPRQWQFNWETTGIFNWINGVNNIRFKNQLKPPHVEKRAWCGWKSTRAHQRASEGTCDTHKKKGWELLLQMRHYTRNTGRSKWMRTIFLPVLRLWAWALIWSLEPHHSQMINVWGYQAKLLPLGPITAMLHQW